MNEPTPSASPTPEAQTPTAAAPGNLPRLRFPFICLLIFWGLTLAIGPLNKPYFFGFMFSLISTALLTLLFFGWWWFNRGLRLWEKSAGFALIIAEAVLVSRFSHRSMDLFAMWMVGLPIVASVIVAWLFVAKKFRFSWARAGFVALLTVVWSGFLLVRTEGADSKLKMATHWRWTPTQEERFLAESRSGSVAPARPSATPSSSESAATNDWIAFRGPDRDGVIAGSSIATNWTTDRPALIWKRAVGPAWSSVLVLRSRLFTQEQRGEKETVVCYDAATGSQIWVHEDTARFEETLSGPGPRATPTFAHGRLYTLGGTGILNCLETETGQAVWKRDIKEVSQAKLPMWAFSSSPLVTDDLVIVYAGGEAGKGLAVSRFQRVKPT